VLLGTNLLKIVEGNLASQAYSGLRHVRNTEHYEVKLRFLQQLVADKDVEFAYYLIDGLDQFIVIIIGVLFVVVTRRSFIKFF
jgi:hypothetical protein